MAQNSWGIVPACSTWDRHMTWLWVAKQTYTRHMPSFSGTSAALTASRFQTDQYFLYGYVFTAGSTMANPGCCLGFVPNFLVSHNGCSHGPTG